MPQPRGEPSTSSRCMAAGPSAPPPVSATQTPSPELRARVVICGGVDCMGLGGGAALLEIEELCAEASSGGLCVQATSGVCTLQCANAPNVNVLHQSSDGRCVSVSNHLRVDTAGRCAEVLLALVGPEGPAVRESLEIGSIMLKRAAGLRWNALRQLARCHNTYALHGFAGEGEARADGGPGAGATPTAADRAARAAAKELLTAALRAEASAARSSEPASARAKRRAERLTARVEALESEYSFLG